MAKKKAKSKAIKTVQVPLRAEPEQLERWKAAAEDDDRTFANWARLVMDKAAKDKK